MASNIKLLPCPCCGSEAKIGILARKHFIFYQAVCLECGMKAESTPTPELTAEKWNTRKPMDHYKLGNCTNDCEHFDNAVVYGYTKAIDDFAEKLSEVCHEQSFEVSLGAGHFTAGLYAEVLTLDGLAEIIFDVAEQLKKGSADNEV